MKTCTGKCLVQIVIFSFKKKIMIMSAGCPRKFIARNSFELVCTWIVNVTVHLISCFISMLSLRLS